MIKGVSQRSDEPVFGGSFGDIFRAEYHNSPVALKRLRMFKTENLKKDARQVSLSNEKQPGLYFCHSEFSPRGVDLEESRPRLRTAIYWYRLYELSGISVYGISMDEQRASCRT
jgi:hypothetical protein